MSVEIKPELEHRLMAVAEKRSQTLHELVEEALTSYLNALGDEHLAVVRATQKLLPRVWPVEDVQIEPVAAAGPTGASDLVEDFAVLPFFGMWADRDEVTDAAMWVRKGREQWHQRASRPD